MALLPPAAVLSAVTPAVAKLQLRDLGSTGSVVGRLSAWATAGGLVGTFATGFVIVPLLRDGRRAVRARRRCCWCSRSRSAARGAPRRRRRSGWSPRRSSLGGAAVAVGVAVRRRDALPLRARRRATRAAGGRDARARGPQALLRRPRRPAPPRVRLHPLDRRRDRRRGAARRAARRRLPRRRRLHAAALPARDAARLARRACSRSTASSSSSRASAWGCGPGRTLRVRDRRRARDAAREPTDSADVARRRRVRRPRGALAPGDRRVRRARSGACCGPAASTRSTSSTSRR